MKGLRSALLIGVGGVAIAAPVATVLLLTGVIGGDVVMSGAAQEPTNASVVIADSPAETTVVATLPPETTAATTLPATSTAATTVATTLPPETTVATTLPPTSTTATTSAPPTTAAAATTVAPVEEPLTIVETRAAGPHIPAAASTALSFAGPSGGIAFSLDVCSSGNIFFFFNSVDRNGAPIQGSGYGVVDPAGTGRLSVWYEDNAGRLIAFDQAGDPYTLTMTADAVAVRGARFDLDLVYNWTWTAAHADLVCPTIDSLVVSLAV